LWIGVKLFGVTGDGIMTPELEFGLLSDSEETQQLGTVLSQCFNSPVSESSVYLNRIGLENFRVIRRGSQIVGGLAIYLMGQWFGGQRLPMAGIAAVGVVPEYRGTGVAIELLSCTLKEFYANGVPISVLYPATQRVYRKVGYEQGGNADGLELRLDSIGLSYRDLPIQSVTPVRHEVFQDMYREWAMQTNGNLDRNPAIWERIIQPSQQEEIYAYLIGREAQPEGYIIFNTEAQGKEFHLAIRDWVALNASAGRRLWTFLADHRSQVHKVVWRGCVVNPFLLLLPEQTVKARYLERWMLRVVDVAKALQNRGYPMGLEAELHLVVQDDLLAENNGNFVLNVSGGRGEVTRGGKGELQLDVRGLAPLYTGLFTASELQFSGYLVGSDRAVSVATQMFAGAAPWMPDFF
jgi:predicted acetyltransferase